jgi:plastocyanin
MKTLTALGLLLAGLAVAPLAQATQWHAIVGAQNADLGHQALAFLPDEIWIHAGDSIRWALPTDEIHTVSFLVTGSARPGFPAGCAGAVPGITPSGSSFDGSHCVNSGALLGGQAYTVRFPSTGNFKVTCLVHEDMTAVIHVLPTTRPLPHAQAFYDSQAERLRNQLLAVADSDGDVDRSMITSSTGYGHQVITGAGRVVATPGGHSTVSIMRFMQPVVRVHVGDTVEWGNDDPVTPHTITFGTEPVDAFLPSPNVVTDADGALHATLTSTSGSAHSGFIVAAPAEQFGVAETPAGTTRFRVTFKHAGVYPYLCALHDDLGMKGKVIVDP